MELTCYVYPGWKPRIRAASSRRAWMDATPESFAYRCLPLNIANSHGWEMLSPCGFEAMWNGGSLPSDVTIRLEAGTDGLDAPVALFGQGTLTFHVAGLLRTSPGWSLWVGGSPNAAKDGIAPLSGLVETDWSPYTFTMNWRFTRMNHWIRFDENEPFCFMFPVERNVVANVEPTFVPIAEAAELREQFETWSRSRDAFQAEVARNPPTSPSEKWQKLYYRGVDAHGNPGTSDHMSKLRPHPFTASTTSHDAAARCPVHPAAADIPGEAEA